MTFKSPTQPYCRCCGGPIGKRTELHLFGQGTSQPGFHFEKPLTKAEVQRYVNGQIISVSRWPARDDQPSYVVSANVWDGEFYVDHLFCKQACAVAFGRMCATEYPAIETQRAATARAQRHKEPLA